MTLQKIQEQLLRWTVTLVAIVGALVLVKKAGEGHYGMVAGAFAAILISALLFIMRERTWVLIPIVWPLLGNIPALGVPVTLRDIMVGVVFGIFITLKAFKLITRKAPWNFAMTIATVVLLYVAISWMRNPTGFAALDSDRVGGRPYFNVCVALIACWMLRQCSLSSTRPNLLVYAMVFSRTIEGVLGLLIFYFPGLYSIFSEYYDAPGFTWARSPEEMDIAPGEEGSRRWGFLSNAGAALSLLSLCACRPISMLLTRKFWYPALFLLGLLCIFLSGFRSFFGWTMAATLMSSYLRRGWTDVIKIMISGFVLLCMLILGQGTLYQLPFPMQRTLCFLPGKWDPIAISDANASTEWRVEMWKELLSTNRYIENHTFGDGFGMRKRDLAVIEWNLRWGDDKDRQESYMINGGVHSGPVSTIRCLGYVGLVIMVVFEFAIAIRALKLAHRAKNTPFQTLAYFIALQPILDPIFFIFIFGAVEDNIPTGLYNIGMLQMLENSLDDYEAAQRSEEAREQSAGAPSLRRGLSASPQPALAVPNRP